MNNEGLEITKRPRGRPPAGNELTVREQRMLEQLANGKTYSEIAELEVLTVSSTQYYIARMFDKLGAANASGAVGIGFRRGLLK